MYKNSHQRQIRRVNTSQKMNSSVVPEYTLNNGISIPLIGFGTFAKGRTAGLSYKAILTALDAGYRHLDCAWL